MIYKRIDNPEQYQVRSQNIYKFFVIFRIRYTYDTKSFRFCKVRVTYKHMRVCKCRVSGKEYKKIIEIFRFRFTGPKNDSVFEIYFFLLTIPLIHK